MSYRPTIRYPDVYKDYVEKVFQATTLDRNQIIRFALYVAAHSDEYNVSLKSIKQLTSLSPDLVGGRMKNAAGRTRIIGKNQIQLQSRLLSRVG
ncbi:hypothetical protein SAMN05444673_6642 [Bacillus sp. OV166]|uniref:hypothetical protein n=1 Tax=Bacillus sp. OV166 TaxID=1882763 RepID=UPI000A2AC9F2|nr:hypothetical protein [Bacillus sp. OV166]SMQ86643.1 hypothetical protein SAMN05444673_6642 [Bacillus sp. OV166]